MSISQTNEKNVKKTKGFSISHVNVRSLVKNLGETYLTMNGFDIIRIIETWLSDRVPDSHIHLANYVFVREDRVGGHQVKKRGGSIVIYVKSEIHKYLTVLRGISGVTHHCEHVWIAITKPNFKKQLICVLYRPPSGNVEEFIQGLFENIRHCEDNIGKYELTILGDFNINYKISTSPESKLLKEIERKFQLKQYINVPTSITHKVTNTIDLIFSDMDRIAEFGVLENSMIADHLPIYIIRKKTRTVRSFSYTYGRSYKNYNKEIFQHHILNNMMWKSFWINTNDSELLWQIMLSIIQEACDSICPICKIKLRNNTPSWFTNEIVDMIITKQGLFKKYKESSAEEDSNNFVESRKHLCRALVHAKRTVVMESLREIQNNPKRF